MAGNTESSSVGKAAAPAVAGKRKFGKAVAAPGVAQAMGYGRRFAPQRTSTDCDTKEDPCRAPLGSEREAETAVDRFLDAPR